MREGVRRGGQDVPELFVEADEPNTKPPGDDGFDEPKDPPSPREDGQRRAP